MTPNRIDRIAWGVAAAAVAVAVVAVLAFAVVTIASRPLEYVEGEVLFDASRLRDHLRLYIDPLRGAFDYGPLPSRYYVAYTPLWAWLLSHVPAGAAAVVAPARRRTRAGRTRRRGRRRAPPPPPRWPAGERAARPRWGCRPRSTGTEPGRSRRCRSADRCRGAGGRAAGRRRTAPPPRRTPGDATRSFRRGRRTRRRARPRRRRRRPSGRSGRRARSRSAS